jgi:hypothetical protein
VRIGPSLITIASIASVIVGQEADRSRIEAMAPHVPPGSLSVAQVLIPHYVLLASLDESAYVFGAMLLWMAG